MNPRHGLSSKPHWHQHQHQHHHFSITTTAIVIAVVIVTVTTISAIVPITSSKNTCHAYATCIVPRMLLW